MEKSIIIEAPTMEACRAMAAKKLKVPPESIRLKVLQTGKKGLISNTPFRVRAIVRGQTNAAKAKTTVNDSSLNKHLNAVMEELDNLNLAGREDEEFAKILESYEDLPEERRKEVLEVAQLMSGDTGEKIRNRISKDGTMVVRVTDDRLKVFLDLTPPECMGQPVTMRMVLARLREMGVKQGVNHVRVRELLERVLEKGQPIREAMIGQDTMPEHGDDGFIEFYIMPGKREEVQQADGRIDYRGQAHIAAVKRDDKLARIVAPTTGKPGIDVYGQAIEPTPGKPAQLQPGPNVNFNHDEQVFTAAIDGVMEIEDGVISVHPAFIVNGDVDMNTGNINFKGDVHVSGTVRDRFAVCADGDIDIRGNVEGCEVVSRNGSITVHKGITGRHRCFVSAKINVKAGYIENASVYAGDTVEVDRAIMHSEVMAGNTIIAMKGKGSVMGGILRAGQEVHVKRLGAPSETLTKVEVGINLEEHEKIRSMDQRLVALKNAAGKLEDVIKGMESRSAGLSGLTEADRSTLAKMKKQLVVLHHEIDTLTNERETFLSTVTAECRGRVRVATEAFGRVEIKIGTLVHHIKSHVTSACFTVDDAGEHVIQNAYKG